ncbi:MAG: PilZ domain-containing protein [Planctomycetota bacterium]
MSQKRAFARHGLSSQAFACLLDDDLEPVHGVYVRAKDVSFGGLSVRTPFDPPHNAIILFEFERHDDEPLVLAGQVRHVGKLSNNWNSVGVRFVTPKTQLNLSDLVKRAKDSAIAPGQPDESSEAEAA